MTECWALRQGADRLGKACAFVAEIVSDSCGASPVYYNSVTTSPPRCNSADSFGLSLCSS